MSPNTLTPGIAATGLAATLPAVPANLATSDNSSPKKSNPNADAVSVRVRIGLPVGLLAPAALRPAARSPAVSAALTTFLGTNPLQQIVLLKYHIFQKLLDHLYL